MGYRGSGQLKGWDYRTRRGCRDGVGAFTLVEMLVVVAIIGMLIAIVLPSLGWSREVSRRVVCGTRLNQIGTAMVSYKLQHLRSYGLIEYSSTGSITDSNDNMISLAANLPSLEMFICPSTRNRLSSVNRLRTTPSTTTSDSSSFESYGHFDTGRVKRPTTCKGKESRIWMVFDMDNGGGQNWEMNSADNHGTDGGNVLFADAHVAWTRGDDWGLARWTAQRVDVE